MGTGFEDGRIIYRMNDSREVNRALLCGLCKRVYGFHSVTEREWRSSCTGNVG